MTPVEIRCLGHADVPAAAALSSLVGWNQNQADWERLVALHPATSFGAWRDGALIGTATLVSYANQAAWLGMVIVAPNARGHGLGAALVDAALDSVPLPGAVGLDATEFGAPLYERRGFETVATIDRWSGVLVGDASGSADVRRAGAGDLARLARLDLEATELDRSHLLARLLTEDETVVVALETAGELRAYGALRSGSQRSHVGPLIVTDLEDLAPIAAALAQQAAGAPIYLDAVRQPRRTAALQRLGLTVSRTLVRMTRPRVPLMSGTQVVAATGFEWG